jgi:hypothetical protein
MCRLDIDAMAEGLFNADGGHLIQDSAFTDFIGSAVGASTMDEEPNFDNLGLPHRYTIELDPEYPGNGVWGCPAVGLTAQGTLTEFGESPWGEPLVIRVRPNGAPEWILSIGGGNPTELRGLYATPSPDRFLAVVDGSAILVEAAEPGLAVALGPMVTQVSSVSGSIPVLLLARTTSVAAIDAGGLRWQTRRLCWDGLVIDGVSRDQVMCSGELLPRSPFVLDLKTGEQLLGPVLSVQ